MNYVLLLIPIVHIGRILYKKNHQKQQQQQSHKFKRYERQMILKGFGAIESQTKLSNSKVLIIGCGGLSSAIIPVLAGSGVGIIGLVDRDVVDISNLHRQYIHQEKFTNQLKVDSAKSFINNLNSTVKVNTYSYKLTHENAMQLFEKYDVIIDATDNLQAKYTINDACVLLQKPLVFGAAIGLTGQVTTFDPNKGCYRCLFDVPIKQKYQGTCSENGVIGSTPSIIGNIQALEALKVLLSDCSELGKPLNNRLLLYDSRDYSDGMSFQSMKYSKKSDCIICGSNPSIKTMKDSHDFCIKYVLPTTNNEKESNLNILADKYTIEKLYTSNSIVIDVRNSIQYKLNSVEGAINIPFYNNDNFITEITRIDTTNRIILLCNVGQTSRNALLALLKHDSTNKQQFYNLKGGLRDLEL